MNKITSSIAFGLFFLTLNGCAPEVGSEAWCREMEKKTKGDWSMNEATEYAKNCIFRKSEEQE